VLLEFCLAKTQKFLSNRSLFNRPVVRIGTRLTTPHRKLAIAIAAGMLVSQAHAGPEGGNVVGGGGSIHQDGLNTTIVQDTQKLVLGNINANGHVILMNPHGVFFGRDAKIDVGGLVASGLAINPDDFMNGDFAFNAIEGTDGAVINQGLITAATGGDVVLQGKSVDNQGLITANLGSVALAAGEETVLTANQQRFSRHFYQRGQCG